jgi:hypothetical protein
LGNNIRSVKRNEFPFVVFIIRSNNRRQSNPEKDHICTGTLITNRDIATAAHCMEHEIKILVKIVIGSNDIRIGQKYSVFWWISYEVWANRKGIPIESDCNDVMNIRVIISFIIIFMNNNW